MPDHVSFSATRRPRSKCLSNHARAARRSDSSVALIASAIVAAVLVAPLNLESAHAQSTPTAVGENVAEKQVDAQRARLNQGVSPDRLVVVYSGPGACRRKPSRSSAGATGNRWTTAEQ